jgi:hypothetical protein
MPREATPATRTSAWRLLLPGLLLGFAALLCLGLWHIEGMRGALLFHVGAMVTAWAAVLPAGAIIARYLKVTPGQRFPAELDNRCWWDWHRGLQYMGVALSTLGFLAILSVTGGSFATWHGWIGLAVVLIGWGQLVAGWLRGSKGGPTAPGADPARPETWRGDHFDMTRRRRIFELVHKRGGWLALLLGVLAVDSGAALFGAPGWLMLLAALAWLAALLTAAAFAAAGRRVETYVAIWGPELRSPLLPAAVNAPRAADARADARVP